MQEFIFQANISRFQILIAQEADVAKRDRLKRLLVEEEHKLQAYRTQLESAPPQDRTTDGANPPCS